MNDSSAATSMPPASSTVDDSNSRTAREAGATLGIRGCELTSEETAAVVALIAQLASAEPVTNDTGGTGPTDRATQRSHRLQLGQHGLWGRPGPSSWQAVGGVL